MNKNTFLRDLLGTLFMFFVLVGVTAIIILGENFLENFKSH